MVENNKKEIKVGLWLTGTLFLISAIAVVTFLINDKSEGNSVEISSSENVSGIKCVDTSKMSFIFRDYKPTEHVNIVKVAFMGNKLTSITYAYEGRYVDGTEADHARDFAEAAYGLNLTDNLELDITTFAKNMSVSGDKVYFTVTAADDSNLNSKTAPIFMLEQEQDFPTTLESMRSAYEGTGFSCEMNN